MRPCYLLAAALLAGPFLHAADPVRISLNGTWKFAADYQDWGERFRWFDPSYRDGVWDHVKVPHVWSLDPRFPAYVGAGWYRMRFPTPAGAAGNHVRLAFDAVFSRARVWLNGKLLGEHDGGYTPFEFDIGPLLLPDQPNLLVVRADNRWKENTIPGAHPGPDPHMQVKAWWDDGGIVRDVHLIVSAPVYIANQKIEADPDLRTGTAAVRVKFRLRNTLEREVPAAIRPAIWFDGKPLDLNVQPVRATLKASSSTELTWSARLDAAQVRLWGLDTPVLYELRTAVEGGSSATQTFGIRKFETSGTRLLLNGKPLRLGGANRVPSHSDWGQNDPPEGVAKDLSLMKEAGLVLARMSHYPLSRAAIEWGDRHGMLFVEEAIGSTQPELQDLNRGMYREMIERDWNSPSIVAWSIGNEFASETPEGVKYVQQMRDYVRSLDPTRLITFATNRVTVQVPPEQEGSYYVDFVSMNTYSDPEGNGRHIDIMHQRYPDKPLVVSEYGMRVNFVDDETEREEWFRKMVDEIRKRPFVSGASVWTFNDYRSRYVGTSPNGYREWGLVGPSREVRGSYHVLRHEFSGYRILEAQLKSGAVTVRVAARDDFPVYPPAQAELRIRMMDGQGRLLDTRSAVIRPLAAGETQELRIPAAPGASGFRGEIRRGEFRTLTFGAVRP